MFWTFGQQIATQALGFFVSVILARLLLPAEFGLIGMITVFVGIGYSLINTGFSQSLIRTQNPDQEDYSTVFYFNLSGSVLIYWVLFFSAPLVAVFFSQPILVPIIRVYCLTFIISAFSEVQLTKLTKEMNFKLQMVIAIPSIVISGLLGILLAYRGYGVWSLVWMQVCQSFLTAVQLWVRTKWMPSFIFKSEKFKSHFKFGYKLTLSSLIETVFSNIYAIIIGKFFLPAQVGFYTRADSLQQLPANNISTALNKVSYPLFASIQNDGARLKTGFMQIMQMVVSIVAPVLIIMGVLAQPLFRFLFTEKWLPCVPYFQILCLTGILYPLHSYNLNILNVKGRSDLFFRLEIIKKIGVVIMILTTIRFGIIGLVWGQLISSILGFFVNSYYSKMFLDYSAWQQIRDIFPLIICALIAGIFVWGLDFLLKGAHDGLRLLAGMVAGATIYILQISLFKSEIFKQYKLILTNNYL